MEDTIPIDFEKLPADKRITVHLGPSGGSTLGITDVDEPLADEINNVGGASGMQPASQSISWNDYSFGTEASEVLNEPSLADAASYEEFGQSNYGGEMSFYYPEEYDDDSNLHSVIYDLTDIPGERQDVTVRVDGDVETTADSEDGDFVSVYRVQGVAEANPFTPGESKRRTVTFWNKSDFSHFTVVGDHAITAIPPAVDPWEEGAVGRIRASQQGRDTTNRLRFTTDDPDVIQVYPGGFYQITGSNTDEAVVTITDPGTNDTQTVAVTVGSFNPPVVPTGVTAGIPGEFTPGGAEVPADLAALILLGALGQTSTWTEGQYVELGDLSHAYWDGSEWKSGEVPA